MANDRAFICICVEGNTDVRTLSFALEELFDDVGGEDIQVVFRTGLKDKKAQGDITSLNDVTPENIERKIYKYYFKKQDKSSEIGWNDFTHIIHIVDLDGCFISSTNIMDFTDEDEAYAKKLSTEFKDIKVLYYDDHIATSSGRDNIVKRNKQKSKNLQYLYQLDAITVGKKKIKYNIFFFASNIEHVLYGKANLSSEEKISISRKQVDGVFDAECLQEIADSIEICPDIDYVRSWKNIIVGNNNESLGRRSNINVLINMIKNSSVKDWL